MTEERLMRSLGAAFDSLADAHTPDYLEAAIERASSTRQRPAWTFPERWLPMDVATRAVPAPTFPWRQLGVLALLVVLVAAAVVAYIGAQPRLPAPFGVAANGLIADDAGGDIRTIDPATGEVTVIVGGPDVDSGPWFSRDGTRIVFIRTPTGADDTTSLLYSVAVDGSALTRLTPEPITDLRWYEFTPDNGSVIIKSRIDGKMAISLAHSDGTGLQTFEDVPVGDDGGLALRPPTGSEVLFVTLPGMDGRLSGISSLDLATGTVAEVLPGLPDTAIFGDVVWSPSGEQFAYGRSYRRANIEMRIADADGSNDHVVGSSEGAQFVAWPQWSPDGTKLLFERGVGQDAIDSRNDVRPVVIDVATGAETEIDVRIENGAGKEWAPDGTVILAHRMADDGSALPQEFWDVSTGAVSAAPWESRSYPAWQRLAP